jgi:hypothetical protein
LTSSLDLERLRFSFAVPLFEHSPPIRQSLFGILENWKLR